MIGKCFTDFLCKQINICFTIAFFIRNFKSATEINKFKLMKMRNNIKQHLNSFYKNINIFYITACMNVEIINENIMLFNYCKNFINLVNRNSEFAFIVT